MLSAVTSFAIDGVETRRVIVEADVRNGLPAFTVVGLADKSVREARERVRGAITNSGFAFPQQRITVNLAPAYLRKNGPHFDLPLALAVLAATGQLDPARLRGCAVAGELGLTGELRPMLGALALAEGALRAGLEELVVPLARAREASLVGGLDVIGVSTLTEAVEVLRGNQPIPALPEMLPEIETPSGFDMADVCGHNGIIDQVAVAVAGGHHLHLQGPPGTGKTMLARRLPGVLPLLDDDAALEVTRIHSVAGTLPPGAGLMRLPPFRAPHHTASTAAIVGGGNGPRPGEASLAHG
ncbi:MAG: magnesium chelatase family protein, partial [Solirubrobacteraceae bacterium]|nr:magnesium chelatase family protein [Solirubrobacteraceae bacterium]